MKDIWFLRSYYIKKFSEQFLTWFVWHLPKVVIKWAAIRLIAHATTGKYETTIVPDLTAMDALRRWDKD